MEYNELVKRILKESDDGFKIAKKELDEYVSGKKDELKKTATPQPDFYGEMRQAAIPSALAKKAIYFGAMNVAFRVIPRMAIPFLETIAGEIAGRVLGLMVGKAALKKVPLAGQILGIIAGFKLEKDFNSKMQDYIVSVLGSRPPKDNYLQLEPFAPADLGKGMREQMNDHVAGMKRRVAKEPRRKDPVRTHNPNGRGQSRIP